MIWFSSLPAPHSLRIFQVQVKKTRNGSDKPYAYGPLEGKHQACMTNTTLPTTTGNNKRFSLHIWCRFNSDGSLHPSFSVLQITVYDQEHFQGRRMEFTASCQNIMECGMENIRSLKVECGAYVSRDLPFTS